MEDLTADVGWCVDKGNDSLDGRELVNAAMTD